MNFWDKVSALDRRWIYLLVALSVVFPLIYPMSFKISITPEARQLFDAVEALPDSSVVLLTFDYYPSTVAETEPMAIAALHHLFRKDCKVLTLSTIPLGGPSMAERVTRLMAETYGKEYGVDFVNLGYKANYVAVLQGLGSSIESIYPADNRGARLSELPMMEKIKNYADVDFIFVISDNEIVTYWISIVNAQYGTPVGAGVTAVSAPKYYAFVGSGQLTGLLGGMKGAAEYELLVEKPDLAEKGMGMQSLAHLMIIFMVIVGNISYFAGSRSQRRQRI